MVVPSGQSRVLVEAREFRAAVLADDRAMLADLLAAYRPVMRRLEARILEVAAQIAKRAATGEATTPGAALRLAQYQELVRATEAAVSQYTARVSVVITSQQRQRIERAISDARRLVDVQLPGSMTTESLYQIGRQWAVVDAEALEVLVGAMRDGSTLQSYLQRQIVRGTVQQLGATLEAGILENPRETARRMRAQLAGGAVQALRVARTETLRAYREAERAQYQANPDLITGYRRMAELDERCCPACWIMDGTLYKSESDMDEHVQGRCFTVPEMVSPRELGIPVDAEPLVDEADTGRARFLGMDEAGQRAVVKNDRLYDAYASGRIGLNGLVRVERSAVWGNALVANSAVRALAGEVAPRLPSFNQVWLP